MIPTLEEIIRALLAGTMVHTQAAHYLKLHEDLQRDVDNDISDVPYTRGVVLMDVIKKCVEQDGRWGQRVYPNFFYGMTAWADTSFAGLANTHGVLAPDTARWLTQTRASDGELSWMDILTEEVAKLCEKYEQPQALRDQLIDVAGVAVQWAAQLSHEPAIRIETTENSDGTMSMTAHVDADHEGPGAAADEPA